MSFCRSFGVYNNRNELLKSFDCYDEALKFIKSLHDIDYLNVLYLFDSEPTKVIVSNVLYIQKYLESGGGVSRFGNKYYYKK